MLKFFQNKHPLMFIFYVLISIFIVLVIPVNVIKEIVNQEHAFLYKNLLLLISGEYFIVFYKIIIALLLIVNAYVFNKLIISIKLFKTNNSFPGFLFLILIGFAVVTYDNLNVLISSLFVLFAINIIFDTLRKGIAVFEYLNVGILFSIAFLFWETTLYFSIIIFISILILRIQNWREWVASIIGLLLPIFIIVSIYFFIYSDFDIIFDTYHLFFRTYSIGNISVYEIVILFFVFALSLFSLFKILFRFNSIESNNQDYYKIFSLFFLIAVIITLLIPSNIFNNYTFAIISLSVVFSSSFLYIKNKIISEILFDSFLILSILVFVL